MLQTVQTDAVILYGLVSDIDFVTAAGYPLGSLLVDEVTGLEYSVGTDGLWFPRKQLIVNAKGEVANNIVNEPGVIIYLWDGATNDGPTNAPMGATGFNQNGGPTGNVYIYDKANTIWRDTTQTVAGYHGK